MTDWPPARSFFGLHVDGGFYQVLADRWVRLPVATFTCRWGCERTAVGVADVIDLTRTITDTHARSCPGPDSTEPNA